MNENPDLIPPKVSGADHLHAAGRAGLSAIPWAGGAAMEIFNAVITPPIERRRQKWMAAVGAAIEELKKTDANIVETLQNNEQFQSVLLQTSWAAVRNHQIEKLAALKHAVINAARGTDVPSDEQLLFVRYVDELTPTHLVVMKFLEDHENEVSNLASYQVLFESFSQSTGQTIGTDFFKLSCEDLKSRNLVRISNHFRDFPGLHEQSLLLLEQENEDKKIIITDMGHAFVKFVLTNQLRVTS